MSADTEFASTLREPHLGEPLLPLIGPVDGDLARGRAMQRSLQAMLDGVAGARAALPQLAALESALGQRGTGAVQAIAPKDLAKVQHQLRVLPLNAADGVLQDLLALVQGTLRKAVREERTHQLSPFDPQSTVVISEGTESDFINALNEARGGQLGR